MNRIKLKPVLATALVSTVLWAGTACSPPAAGDLGTLQTLAGTCPDGAILVSYVAYDVSGSGQSQDLTAAREAALTDIVTKVAACGGHLRVDAFTGSAAASRIAFDGELNPEGATQIAKLRKVPTLVTTTVESIGLSVAASASSLDPTNSDITSQFSLAAEYGKQMAANQRIQLNVDLMTDGVQTIGAVLNTKTLTTATAVDLANSTPVPPLPPTTTVKVSGLGKTTGPPPPTSYVDALKVFYDTYCARTGAASCSAVTDYTGGT